MKIAAEFFVNHVNNRREKAGQNLGPMASDIKLSTEVTPEDLKELFSTDASFDRLLGGLWNDDKELTTNDLDSLKLKVKGVGCTVRFTSDFAEPLTLDTADVNKIVVTPLPGRRVQVSLRVQSRTSKEQRGQLSEWQECTLVVTVASRQGELNLPAKNKELKTTGKDTLDEQEETKDASAPVGQKPPQRPKSQKSSKVVDIKPH